MAPGAGSGTVATAPVLGPDCWFLSGPTAAGKSDLAVELARELGAEVLSVDSMAVYRGLDVGTAKPTPDQRQAVPHHLLDLVAPAEPFSVARWLAAAAAAVADVRSRGRRILFVGGTPLYLRALRDGLASLPPADPDSRAALTAEAARLGVTEVLWFHGGAVHLLPGQDAAWAKDVQVYAVPLSRSPQQLYQLEAFRSQLVTAPWRPLAAAQRWLQQFVSVDATNVPADGFVRTFARASTPPADAVVVDDQLVRLWAASEARDRQRRGEATATGLAASYRVVTAGASAVVLERREQYDEHKLEPGAISGREPPELLGGQPVPEPATWLLLGSGLVVIAWRQRRRSLAARTPSV